MKKKVETITDPQASIFFREAKGPYPEGGEFWHVEFYPEATPTFPVGLAVVWVANYQGHQSAQLNFIFVADQWRCRGIARRLVSACLDRWPRLIPTGPMSEIAQKLLNSFPQFCRDDHE